MGINLAIGEKIPLFLLTESRVSGKVVRARIRDKDGAEITGSPVTVAHLADGEYFDDSIAMPNTAHIVVTYDVFDGPGFTNPTAGLLPAEERFDSETFVAGEFLSGTIVDSEQLAGQIIEEKVTGVFEAEEAVSGGSVDETLVGGDIADEELTGGDIDGV